MFFGRLQIRWKRAHSFPSLKPAQIRPEKYSIILPHCVWSQCACLLTNVQKALAKQTLFIAWSLMPRIFLQKFSRCCSWYYYQIYQRINFFLISWIFQNMNAGSCKNCKMGWCVTCAGSFFFEGTLNKFSNTGRAVVANFSGGGVRQAKNRR